VTEHRSESERRLHLRESLAEATVRADAEGGVDARRPVLRPLGTETLDVETRGIAKVLFQPVRGGEREENIGAGGDRVAREGEGVRHAAQNPGREGMHSQRLHEETVRHVDLLRRRHIRSSVAEERIRLRPHPPQQIRTAQRLVQRDGDDDRRGVKTPEETGGKMKRQILFGNELAIGPVRSQHVVDEGRELAPGLRFVLRHQVLAESDQAPTGTFGGRALQQEARQRSHQMSGHGRLHESIHVHDEPRVVEPRAFRGAREHRKRLATRDSLNGRQDRDRPAARPTGQFQSRGAQEVGHAPANLLHRKPRRHQLAEADVNGTVEGEEELRSSQPPTDEPPGVHRTQVGSAPALQEPTRFRPGQDDEAPVRGPHPVDRSQSPILAGQKRIGVAHQAQGASEQRQAPRGRNLAGRASRRRFFRGSHPGHGGEQGAA